VNRWFKDEDEASRHREMLADPSAWPGDVLSLKRPQAIMEDGPYEASFARVYAVSPLTVVDMGGTATVYTSAQEMLDDGWVVD